MLGSAEEWFYRGLGGIDVNFSREGAERIELRPVVVGNVTWVRTRYNSAVGPIQSDWKRNGRETEYSFTIPPNETATIEIESGDARAATVNDAPAAMAPGVVSEHVEGNRMELTVGSGTYNVRAEALAN